MFGPALRAAVLAAGIASSLALAAPPGASAGYLVFSRGSDIWVARDDGSSPQLLVTAAQAGEVRLSKPAVQPGGDAIAFESWNTDSQRVYDWEAGTLRKVGNGWATGNIFGGAGASSNDPDVTADKRVIFQSDAVAVTGGCDLYGCGSDGTSSSGLVSVRFDGEDRRALPGQCDSAREPASNPANAAQFAYVGCWVDLTPGDPWDPIAYALRKADATTDVPVSYDDKVQHDPAWSPDGTQIVTSEEGNDPGIWVYGAGGDTWRRVVVPQAGATPFASPRFLGSDRIVFAKNGDLWTVPAGGTDIAFPDGATQLTHLGGISDVAWTSAGSFRTSAPVPPAPPAPPANPPAPPTTTGQSGPPTTTPQPAALGLSGLQARPATFRALRRGGSVVRAGGLRVTFTVTEAARVTFGVKTAAGATVKGTFTVAGKRGVNRLRFSGRLAQRTLKPGRYRLTATARATDGRRSPMRTVAFRVVR